MPRVLAGVFGDQLRRVLSPACHLHSLWIRDGGDGRMLTRLKNWIQGSRQKKRERWEAERGNLGEQDKRVVDEYMPGTDPAPYPTKGFDETRRGRPGN
jgi:hypothetical protein